MELAFAPISLRMATARQLFSAASLLDASTQLADDTGPNRFVVVTRNSGLPTDALSMTREAGALLAQAVDGFAQLYPSEALRTDALRGAATGASNVQDMSSIRQRIEHWTSLARGTASLLLSSAPAGEQVPGDPSVPRVSRRMSQHMAERL